MNIFSLIESVTPSLTIDIADLSGASTGETLTLKNPSSGDMTRAFNLYVRELNRIKKDNQALLMEGDESGDYSDYNAAAAPAIAKLDMAFAVTAIEKWSLDDELTEATVEGLLNALPYLIDAVVSAEWSAKSAHAKK